MSDYPNVPAERLKAPVEMKALIWVSPLKSFQVKRKSESRSSLKQSLGDKNLFRSSFWMKVPAGQSCGNINQRFCRQGVRTGEGDGHLSKKPRHEFVAGRHDASCIAMQLRVQSLDCDRRHRPAFVDNDRSCQRVGTGPRLHHGKGFVGQYQRLGASLQHHHGDCRMAYRCTTDSTGIIWEVDNGKIRDFAKRLDECFGLSGIQIMELRSALWAVQ